MSYPAHHYASHKSSTNKSTKTIDSLAYVVGIGGNLAVLPQIMAAWRTDGPGLSVLTWVLFSVFGCVWLLYAIAHKSKPMIIAQTIGIFCSLLVVAGWYYNH